MRRFLFSIETLWVILVVVAAFAFGCRNPIRPNDFWWHVKVGEIVVATGQVPSTDVFSYTAYGQPWLYQSWLAEVAFYVLHTLGRLELIAVAQGLLVATATALVCFHAWTVGRRARLAALVTALMVGISMAHWNVRPQSFSYPLFALFGLALWHDRRQGTRWIWALPILMVLWVNLHGAFTLGLALVVLTLAGETLKRALGRDNAMPWRRLGRLAVVGVLCLLACVVNPRGLDIVQYLVGFQAHEITQTLGREWQPTTPREFTGMLFFGSILLCLAALAYSARRLDLTDLLFLLAFGWLGLGAIRGTVWYGMVAAPILARYLVFPLRTEVYDLEWLVARFRRRGDPSPGPPQPAPLSAALNLILLCVLALGAALALPWVDIQELVPESLRGNLSLVSPDTPVQAADYLIAHAPDARIFHTESYGSYFAWRFYSVRSGASEPPVFVDTRLELYPPAVWNDYLALGYGRHDWETLLARYDVDTLVLDKERLGNLAAAAQASPHWTRVHDDAVTVIYRRVEVDRE